MNLPTSGTKVVLKKDKRSLKTVFSVAGGLVHPGHTYTVWNATVDDDGVRVLITLREHETHRSGRPQWLPFDCFTVDTCWCPHRLPE